MAGIQTISPPHSPRLLLEANGFARLALLRTPGFCSTRTRPLPGESQTFAWPKSTGTRKSPQRESRGTGRLFAAAGTGFGGSADHQGCEISLCRGSAGDSFPDPWPSWGFLYNDSAFLPQENIIWLVTLKFIPITGGDYALEHAPQGSNCLSAFLPLDGRKTIHDICRLTTHVSDSGHGPTIGEPLLQRTHLRPPLQQRGERGLSRGEAAAPGSPGGCVGAPEPAAHGRNSTGALALADVLVLWINRRHQPSVPAICYLSRAFQLSLREEGRTA
nr:uncharacterized protein LOC105880512 [Microcebus murinus]